MKAATVLIVFAAAALCYAQTNTRPTFEVASIKRNTSGDFRVMAGQPDPSMFRVTNLPLQVLVTLAYRIKDFQLSKAPEWLQSERYDVVAKAESEFKPNELGQMLQGLLEERLQLKIHRETKELPIYALVVSKLGKLQETTIDCGPAPTGPPPPPDRGKPPAPPCGGFFVPPGRVTGRAVRMSFFTHPLSRMTGRIVVDKTGLTGKYDIDLQFTPESGPFPIPGGLPPDLKMPPPDPNAPSLSEALQEQLGLKLESQKGPVEMIVIDHIERPTEN